MKLLSVSIAAYNVEQFLKQTLESFLVSDKLLEYLEVIIVSDGSSDHTVEIAREYEKKYPGCFVVVDKENGGYGSTINSSLKIACGKYFKTVDGDDWVDTKGLETLLDFLKMCEVDLIISKFSTVSDVDGSVQEITNGLIYNNKVEDYDYILEYDKPPFLTMHALTFKTELLRQCGLKITEKCFYTDAELVMKPLPYIRDVVKLDANIYMYRIGREGQSISLRSRLKHMDEAVRVNLVKCALIKRVFGNDSISSIKKEYLGTAILHDIAFQYYFFLVLNKRESLEALREFDRAVYESGIFLYEGVLKTKYGTIIQRLRQNDFERRGIIPFLYHLKMKCIDLRK